ncbi:MAG: phosphate ABC transporter substrate-binding protein PstS [Ramlibacter sp.]
MKNPFAPLLVFLLISAHGVSHAAETVSGAGSSAAAPIYQAWARAYKKSSGVDFAYEPIGSSAGLKKIRAHETGFGASDVAPSDAELGSGGLVVFPVAITGIAPVVNLPRLADGQLKLTGELLARIFLGEVAQWNAPEIARLNPGFALPPTPITVVVRGDGSGTTYNFADYLAKVSPTWKAKYGVKTGFDWPANYKAVKGSDAVAKAVNATAGAIGYVDFGYVKDNKLASVQMKNADGEFVGASIGAFRSALSNSEWVSTGSFTSTLTNKPGKQSWPITMGTFVLVPKVTDKAAQTLPALRFFVWSFLNGDALVQENNFVRLPDRVQAAAFKAITSVQDAAGHPIGMGVMGSSNAVR